MVQDRTSQLILGYINRSELRYGIERAKRERTIPPAARCFFTPPPAHAATPASATISTSSTSFASGRALSIDFARFIDPTPLTVHPRLPLETVMEIFKKVGPRVVLVEHHGKLCGIVTRKDVLRFQFKMENREHPRNGDEVEGEREREERLWALIEGAGGWLRDRLFVWRRREQVAQGGVSDGVEQSSNVELDDRPRGVRP